MTTLQLNSRENEILNIAIGNWETVGQLEDRGPVGELMYRVNKALAYKSITLAAVSQLLSDMREDPTWTPGCHQREVLAMVRNVRSQLD